MAEAIAQRRFPRVEPPGGWELGPHRTLTSMDRGLRRTRALALADPIDFLSAGEFAARVGMTRAFYQLRQRDGGIWVCDPDVLTGDNPGWTEARCVTWGIENGLLEEDGSIPERRLHRRPGDAIRAKRRKFQAPLKSWRKRTQVYLNVVDFAAGLGVGPNEPRAQRRRGLGCDPTIWIGPWEPKPNGPPGAEDMSFERSGGAEGWALERVEAWAPQMGKSWTRPAYIVEALERLEKETAEREGRLL